MNVDANKRRFARMTRASGPRFASALVGASILAGELLLGGY